MTLYQPYFKDLNIPDKVVKKFLKVGLYTSLNGGNPSSNERLLDNIKLNAKEYVESNKLLEDSLITINPIFDCLKHLLDDFELVKEVKDLSSKSFDTIMDGDKRVYYAYTVDRQQPYEFDSGHKGISRVLQGFEVVLLTTLVHSALSINAKIVSLDHDGALIMISQKQFESYNNNALNVAQKISEGKFYEFSKYLLEQNISIEPKRIIYNGESKEF